MRYIRVTAARETICNAYNFTSFCFYKPCLTTLYRNASLQHFKPLFLFLLHSLLLKNRLIVVRKVLTSCSSCSCCSFVPVFADFIFKELEKHCYCVLISINTMPKISSKSNTIVSALFSYNNRHCHYLCIFVDCQVI